MIEKDSPNTPRDGQYSPIETPKEARERSSSAHVPLSAVADAAAAVAQLISPGLLTKYMQAYLVL